ncbi:hypothetical protein Tco_1370078 [Tanacetum coccineum]
MFTDRVMFRMYRVVQNQDRVTCTGEQEPFGYGRAQNRMGNANPGQARQVKQDVANASSRDGGNMDKSSHCSRSDDCDAYDSDVDDAPTAQTLFMANLSSADPVYLKRSVIIFEKSFQSIKHIDHYQDAICDHHEEHEMHDDVQPNHVVDSHE